MRINIFQSLLIFVMLVFGLSTFGWVLSFIFPLLLIGWVIKLISSFIMPGRRYSSGEDREWYDSDSAENGGWSQTGNGTYRRYYTGEEARRIFEEMFRQQYQQQYGSAYEGADPFENAYGGRQGGSPFSASSGENPYTVFDLPETATDADIKKRYRELVRKWHPDRFAHLNDPEKTAEAAKEFERVQTAYDSLKKMRGF